ncbi:DUF2690 domain-containing protein [Streptomyces sp. NPDC014734]|uniref:DUF2690 domain-containing protein n=1 Tax=Streptomyces sp. NPDC014734 TaxID=3364886 RepID=UPI0036FB186B
MARTRIGTAVAAMLVAGVLALPSAPAAAMSGGGPGATGARASAAGCKGASCTGKDPHVTTCDRGAETLDHAHSAGGGPVVQLRVSARCSSAWAYVPKGFDGYRFGLQARKKNAKSLNYVESASFNRVMYTSMVWSSYQYRACVEHYGSGGKWACTPWH